MALLELVKVWVDFIVVEPCRAEFPNGGELVCDIPGDSAPVAILARGQFTKVRSLMRIGGERRISLKKAESDAIILSDASATSGPWPHTAMHGAQVRIAPVSAGGW